MIKTSVNVIHRDRVNTVVGIAQGVLRLCLQLVIVYIRTGIAKDLSNTPDEGGKHLLSSAIAGNTRGKLKHEGVRNLWCQMVHVVRLTFNHGMKQTNHTEWIQRIMEQRFGGSRGRNLCAEFAVHLPMRDIAGLTDSVLACLQKR